MGIGYFLINLCASAIAALRLESSQGLWINRGDAISY
jgi:hypothetical protein